MTRRWPGRVLVVLAALAAPAGQVPVLAGTGWSLDYDYAGQGADWYGTLRYDIERDFPPPSATRATNGDDFGQGYDALFDRFGHGPPIARTNGAQSEYVFRFGSRPSEGGLCFVDVDCDDRVFCNGAERCESTGGRCAPGALPSCEDGDPCTIDGCDARSDRCEAVPRGRAPEVAGLTVSSEAPGSVYSLLRWDKVAGATHFNVYRTPALPPVDVFPCWRDRIDDTAFVDDGSVPETGLFQYLVTAVGCGGESSLGTNSAGKERRGDPCP